MSARERAWARQQGTRPVSSARRRAQRQVLITWLYHHGRATEVAASWAAALQADEDAVDGAQRALVQVTRRLLEGWGKHAPLAASRTMCQLRSLARQSSP